MKTCVFRVWGKGNMDACNDPAAFDGNYPRCEKHAKIEIESHDEEIKRLQGLIEDRKSRRDLLAKSIGSDYIAPQPPPKNDHGAKPIWPMIIAEADAMAASYAKVGTDEGVRKSKTICAMVDDMKKRHEFGVAKYGVPLVVKNDRDHLSDAYQELLDAIVYLRAQIESMGGLTGKLYTSYPESFHRRTLIRIYAQTIENAIELRTILAERDGR